MATLQEKLQQMIPKWRDEIAQLNKEHGNVIISEVTVSQAYGGMRDVKGLICDTSCVNPAKD